MSKEEEKKESGEVTRREFLKDAGIIVGGAAIGSTALLAACGGEEATKTVTTTATAAATTITETETVSKFVCPYDGLEFDTFDALVAHIETEHPGEVQTITKYVCPYDNQEFPTLAALEAHLNSVHGGESPAGPVTAMPGVVTYTINGSEVVTKVQDNWTLAYVLREKLGLTGAKVACEAGDCGVCTVIMDGRPVMSCLVLAVEANGKSIETVEGLAKGGELHPLQQAFINNDAMQCGFCTPGQIMTAKALLDFNSNPTKEEVKEFMAGTLCRCGAQPYIVDAILEAA